jgi:hypothetical protein
MPTKPLDRLMFAQGSLCFFCKQPLPKSEASVEHLLASANGGSNSDENCVACCKTVNALLGSMSLKEKFQVVLNQNGKFKCPNGADSAKTSAKPKAPTLSKSKDNKLAQAIANLKQRGNAKPRKLKTLKSSISTLFPKGISEAELTELVQQLESAGKITVIDNKVTYAL